MRCLKTLKKYNYEIVYVQGKFNVVADAFSRINQSPYSELYTLEDEEEISDRLAVICGWNSQQQANAQ
jgi:hypothetical protein